MSPRQKIPTPDVDDNYQQYDGDEMDEEDNEDEGEYETAEGEDQTIQGPLKTFHARSSSGDSLLRYRDSRRTEGVTTHLVGAPLFSLLTL